MSYPYEDNEDYEPDPFDYEWYGPNSDYNQSGFHGHGFDDHGFDDQPNYHNPKEPEQKLADWERDDPKSYAIIMKILTNIALNRNKRMLRKFGESAGAEKHMQAIEADLDAGNCQLMNTNVNGVMRTCLYDFDPYTGQYAYSEDN